MVFDPLQGTRELDNPMRQSKTEVIRKRISNDLTGHAKTGEIMQKSLFMALASTLFASPYFYHLLRLSGTPAISTAGMAIYGFLAMELFLLFLLSLLCAAVGFSFAGRRALPGFGKWSVFVKDLTWLFLLGMALITLSILFFDLRFHEISPSSYPTDLIYLVTFPLKGALTEEIILRLGLVTIGAGLFRHRAAGVVLAAILSVFFSMKYFQFIGVNLPMTGIILPHILVTATANLILGYLFITRGLIHAMSLNFLLKLKYTIMICVIG